MVQLTEITSRLQNPGVPRFTCTYDQAFSKLHRRTYNLQTLFIQNSYRNITPIGKGDKIHPSSQMKGVTRNEASDAGKLLTIF